MDVKYKQHLDEHLLEVQFGGVVLLHIVDCTVTELYIRLLVSAPQNPQYWCVINWFIIIIVIMKS